MGIANELRPTGVIRRIDDLGRLVIPKEIRRILRIRENDPLELFISGSTVVVAKYNPVKPVEASLELLKQAVEDEPALDCADELLIKIKEMAVILQQAGQAYQ